MSSNHPDPADPATDPATDPPTGPGRRAPRRRRRRPQVGTTSFAVSLVLVTSALSACGIVGSSEDDAGTVTVLGAWSGAEQDSFLAMVEPWEEETGNTVEYTGTRDLNAQLTAGIASGNLPDVAGLPGPGPMLDFYEQGALKPLEFVDFDEYSSTTPPGFAELGQAGDEELVGVFVRAAVKGLVFYDPQRWDRTEPADLDELTGDAARAAARAGDGTRPWCVGLESGAASGWPGTDWIEDIVLRQSGPEAYDAWVSGELAWTSPEITSAWETFGDVLDASYGGDDFVVSTNFGKAANPMFDDPPGCLLHHQASFITDFFANEAGAGEGDYDFFPFPDIDPQYSGSVTGAGDLIGMFEDSPEARSLIEYLLTPEAQQIWVERGGTISGSREVPLDAYPDESSRRSAAILQDAETFRFDASDQMPVAMNDAFIQGVVRFAQDRGSLATVLDGLDQVQADAYAD